MNLPALFIHRPVATILLALGILCAGFLAFALLPVAPLPQVDFPTISVSASLPGGSPETMAATVATPLERSLGRIAGISEMTSESSQGQTRITLQFDLDRSIDGAARDVQAAINAARALLPTGLPSNPNYRKLNPADSPVMLLALTSPTVDTTEMYDAASTVLAQKLSQVDGVGQVSVSGASLPAVRVELNPAALSANGIGVDSVRRAIVALNARHPKGAVENDRVHWQIYANDQAATAAEYADLVVGWNDGAAVRLRDVADIIDSQQDVRNAGYSDGKRSIILPVFRQPGANIIETVDHVKAELPILETAIPHAIDLSVVRDRTPTIRAALHDVEQTLVIAVILVTLVVFLFLKDWRATLIPAVAVPLSLVGTFGIMYLYGYSLNMLSMMALTIATGFVVDDAIVVLENVARHIERGETPMRAALRGASEVGFTVMSMSISLIAVFIPILLMGGIIGRLFHEFAVTLSAAILVSLVVSLTVTPMMCARLLRRSDVSKPSVDRGLFARIHRVYGDSLSWVLRHDKLMLGALLATIGLNVYLYITVPKGFLPQQDTGFLVGGVQADQGISFQAMDAKLKQFLAIVGHDPATAHVVGFTGGSQTNSARIFVTLKPRGERHDTADQVIARLRKKTARVAGASLFLQSAQDIRVGGRSGNAQYQYTLTATTLADLRQWEPKLRRAMSDNPVLADVNTDQQEKGQQVSITVDRDRAARLGLSMRDIDTTLGDLFGQRQIGTIYNPLNQYKVVMEAAPKYLQSPEILKQVYVINGQGESIPLAAVAHFAFTNTPLSVNHQGQFVASTISFNLAPGKSLSDAQREIDAIFLRIGVPSSVQGQFAGTAKVFAETTSNQPVLILAAILAVYIVLGILYESLAHPVTILSTLPSAGLGALLALLVFRIEFSIIAMIGVLLLIGIVKKNAILMIDFALSAERTDGLSPSQAIHQACLVRFRPIMMTTASAMLGAAPLLWGNGEGSEMRQPLGIAIVGGLIVSQILTLYTTPIIYLQIDRMRLAWRRRGAKIAIAGDTP